MTETHLFAFGFKSSKFFEWNVALDWQVLE
jgi:hypothetical protein